MRRTERGSVMYVLDHKNKKVKKFSNKELSIFLNEITKKQFLFVNNKQQAKQLIKKITN